MFGLSTDLDSGGAADDMAEGWGVLIQPGGVILPPPTTSVQVTLKTQNP